MAYGVNIQNAQNVINFDLPWNPAKLKNRISRVYRMGQQNKVFVINLIAEDTIEEKILEQLKKKQQLFDMTIPKLIDFKFIVNNI